jgi:hypothetical protein
MEVMRTSWTVVVVAHSVVVVAEVVVLPPPGNVIGSEIGRPLVVVVPAVVVVAAVVVVFPGNVIGSEIGRPLVVVVAAVVVVEPVVVDWDEVVDPSVVVAPVVVVQASATADGAAGLADAARTASTLPPMASGSASPATRLTVSAVSMCVPSPSKTEVKSRQNARVSAATQTRKVRFAASV